jgi:Zn-dependent protease
MDPASTFALGAIWFVAFLFSTTLHEAGHAFAAYRLGDPTAYHGGQVSLNPLPHMKREPFGMVLVPILSFMLSAARGGSGWMFGWASAPYDPFWAQRHPKRAALMALAGPLANLLIVIVSGAAIAGGRVAGVLSEPARISFAQVTQATAQGGAWDGAATLLSVLFSLNLILFLFNLLPLPPMDGSAVIQLLMTDEVGRRWQQVIAQPMLGLIGLLVAWRVFGFVFNPVFDLALRVLYPGVAYG